MAFQRYLCCGDADGVVGLYDHRTRKLANRWEAHQGPIADMDVGANTLVTCGFSYSNRVQQMVVEPFMKVYVRTRTYKKRDRNIKNTKNEI